MFVITLEKKMTFGEVMLGRLEYSNSGKWDLYDKRLRGIKMIIREVLDSKKNGGNTIIEQHSESLRIKTDDIRLYARISYLMLTSELRGDVLLDTEYDKTEYRKAFREIANEFNSETK